jgi:hypothetical protein
VTGERDVGLLLRSLDPELHDGTYVFALAPGGAVPAGVDPIATVREEEGLTLVLSQEQADRAGLVYDDAPLAWITLRVQSTLADVGLTAAFSAQLTRAGISCNVVAALHHDHIFVPAQRGEEAWRLLAALQERRPVSFDAQLAAELAAMAAEDQRLRMSLADPAAFVEWLTPALAMEMARIAVAHGDRLRAILREHGWPGRSLVGEDGAEAAWLIAQHCDRQLDLQREALALLTAAVAAGEASAGQLAHLTDRVCVNEGRPQRYGTQVTGDAEGHPVSWPIDDPEHVDERRRAAGMLDLAEHLSQWTAEPPPLPSDSDGVHGA